MARLCSAIALCALFAFSVPAARSQNAGLLNAGLDAKVETLLRQMTLQEKIGQLVQYSAGQATGPGGIPIDLNGMIQRGEVGGLLAGVSAQENNVYQRAAGKSRLRIPLIIGYDVIHGYRTVFPIPIALASTWDTGLVERTARIAAREAAASGIRWTFSPMVDIARDPRWGRIAEGAGEDPYLGSQLAAAYIRGYQGLRLDAPDSIAACAKHFVGYGAAEGGRDYNTTEISEHTLREIYLPPFHAAVQTGVATLMSAFNSLNAIPASANAFTLTQILREEWGFRGFVDSDWSAIAELMAHGLANDGAAAARKAMLAGIEMDMMSGLYHSHLAELVDSGQVPRDTIDERVRRILRVKYALGLFEKPYVDETKESHAMLQPDAVALARTAAERSFVLLKNAVGSDGKPVLPLPDDAARIALIGPLADDASNMLGSWFGRGRDEDVITLRAALAKRLDPSDFSYIRGTGVTDGSDNEISAAVIAARKAQVVLLALGEGRAMSGEAASRAQLTLPGRQQELLDKVLATGKPVVLMLFSGRPLTLPKAFEKAQAVISTWAPGIQAGPALVRTLFGEANPSGKLVISWPRSIGQVPLYYNTLNTGRPVDPLDTKPYSTGYIDERHTPQFPFGYGLSYTSFRYAATQLNLKSLHTSALQATLDKPDAVALKASTTITNTGSTRGDEIVQLYVRLEGTSTAQPVRALKGFQRISLAPGESRKVTFDVAPDAFALWDIRNRYAVEPAKATLWISSDSVSAKGVEVGIVP
jgi:beta-glucosidase